MATIDWLEAATGRRVAATEPMVGGMSSTVVRCGLDDGSRLVVRQIDDRDWLAREPQLIEQEAAALRILAGSPLATPTLVATGDSVLAMTEVPGRMLVAAEEVSTRVEAMAEAAAMSAATTLPSPPGLLPWRSWVPTRLKPPAWGDGALWSAAIERYVAGPSCDSDTASSVLLHRDFHPLNLLWTGDSGLPAVFDWVNACHGHPHAELGHCRWNLAVLVDVDAADRFLAHYLDITAAFTWTSQPHPRPPRRTGMAPATGTTPTTTRGGIWLRSWTRSTARSAPAPGTPSAAPI